MAVKERLGELSPKLYLALIFGENEQHLQPSGKYMVIRRAFACLVE